MKVATDEQPTSSATPNDDAQALFPEARARRHRIRFVGAASVVFLLAASFLGATHGGLLGSHPSSSTGSASGGLGLASTKADPHSEIVTVSVVSNPAADPYSPDDLLREAVTLGNSRPSIQVLTAKGIVFYDLPRVVDGVYYSKETDAGVVGWQTSRVPIGPLAAELSPAAAANNLSFLQQISLGSMVKIGEADVSGTATTEYRAAISVVKLQTFGTPSGALASLVYKLAYPASALPRLTFPLEVWADSRGQALQANSTVPAIPTTHVPGAPAYTYTVTLSGFGVQVRATAPARNELIQPPTGSRGLSATVSGKVLVRSSTGREFAERGLLLLYIAPSGKGSGRQLISQPMLVGPGGTYTASVPGWSPGLSRLPSFYPEFLQLSATFYPERGSALACGTRPAQRFVSRTSTNGIDFVCAQ